jgi:hypothetical protein
MSAVVVLAPVLISTWPMFAAAVTTAAASAGFRVVRQATEAARETVHSEEITMENMEIVAESLSHDKDITVERDGVRVTFSRDARGYFKTCVSGNRPKAELKQIGEELAGHVIQNYVHRRLTTELESRGFLTLDQEQSADKSIHLHVRKM